MNREQALNEMARKVTDQMVRAFLNREDKKNKNTRVAHDKKSGDTHMYLHNNRIGTHHADGSITVNHAGYNTKTTRERTSGIAQAVGAGKFHSKKYELHHNGKPVDSRADIKLREETMDPIRSGIQNVLEGNLEQMRQNFNQALAQKAVEKLEEKKLEIASNYFGIK